MVMKLMMMAFSILIESNCGFQKIKRINDKGRHKSILLRDALRILFLRNVVETIIIGCVFGPHNDLRWSVSEKSVFYLFQPNLVPILRSRREERPS